MGEEIKREGVFSRHSRLSYQGRLRLTFEPGRALTVQVERIEAEIAGTDKPIPFPPKYYKDKDGNNKKYTVEDTNTILKRRHQYFEPPKAHHHRQPDVWDSKTADQKEEILDKIYRDANKKAKVKE